MTSVRGRRQPGVASSPPSIDAIRRWYRSRGWRPFPFQEEVWAAIAAGESGLLHAPTGTGKTLAAWLGAILRSGAAGSGIRVVWVTPLKALAADTLRALDEPLTGPQPITAG